jgi:hypothetical protein
MSNNLTPEHERYYDESMQRIQQVNQQTQVQQEELARLREVLRVYPIAGHEANFAALREACYPDSININQLQFVFENGDGRLLKQLDARGSVSSLVEAIVSRSTGDKTALRARLTEQLAPPKPVEKPQRAKQFGVPPGYTYRDGRYYPALPAEITREMIHNVGRRGGASTAQLKAWIKKYHYTAVVARLEGRG